MSKIVIYIGHPAHFHLFKNLASSLSENSWDIFFLVRNKEITIPLLEQSGFRFVDLGIAPASFIGKLFHYFLINMKILRWLYKWRPDLTLSHGSIHLAQMSWLLRIAHISLEDTGNMEQIRLYRPFTKTILVPESFQKDLGKKQIRYPGNHELAYLHPKRFTPDKEVLKALNINPGESYTILRFVAWNATHDAGHRGINQENKIKAVNAFSLHSKVFISSESPLPKSLEVYRLPTPPEKIHDVIAFSSLLYGESATMASEAAVLGIPAIYLDNTGRYYTREEQEKYGLVYNYTESKEDQEKSILKGINILTKSGIKEEWQIKRQQMLDDKIDVTSFLCWFLENWPGSFQIVKENRGNQDYFSHFNSSLKKN
jgi:uncharacterized protein